MSGMLQLTPPIPLWTPRGFAHAHVLIDYGVDHDLQYVCFIVASGECWTFQNADVRLVENATMGRARQPKKKDGAAKAAVVDASSAECPCNCHKGKNVPWPHCACEAPFLTPSRSSSL